MTLLLLLFSSVSFSATFNIVDFGAVGDGRHLNTLAFKKAFSAAGAAGGGVVLVPSPGRFLTSPLNITSHTILCVEEGAEILGVRDKSQYPIIAPLPSYGRSRDVGHTRYQPLIFGVKLTNVTINGGGTIDGQGSYWWKLHEEHKLGVGRPRLVEFMWSRKVEISDVTLKDPGFWNVHPVYCDDVWIHHVKIVAPALSPNSDGIDPDSSSNVVIEHCSISCGDDNIAIKSGMNEAGLVYNLTSRTEPSEASPPFRQSWLE